MKIEIEKSELDALVAVAEAARRVSMFNESGTDWTNKTQCEMELRQAMLAMNVQLSNLANVREGGGK